MTSLPASAGGVVVNGRSRGRRGRGRAARRGDVGGVGVVVSGVDRGVAAGPAAVDASQESIPRTRTRTPVVVAEGVAVDDAGDLNGLGVHPYRRP